VPRSGVISGSLDLVIEIDSPSNKDSEMERRQQICLDSGCSEFWNIYPERKKVRVERQEGTVTRCGPGQAIPVPFTEGATIPVDSIFEGLD
jgi:Uma2 family endonuclease